MATRRRSHIFGWTNELLVENIWIHLKIFCAGSSTKKKMNNRYDKHSKVTVYKEDIRCQKMKNKIMKFSHDIDQS